MQNKFSTEQNTEPTHGNDAMYETKGAPVSDLAQASVPATLLARLLRTIYLTEMVLRKQGGARHGGPNQGYINHPQFSYGDSLQSIIPPIPKSRDAA